jgi:hypothetical protein
MIHKRQSLDMDKLKIKMFLFKSDVSFKTIEVVTILKLVLSTQYFFQLFEASNSDHQLFELSLIQLYKTFSSQSNLKSLLGALTLTHSILKIAKRFSKNELKMLFLTPISEASS